jgi:hypothetical protein
VTYAPAEGGHWSSSIGPNPWNELPWPCQNCFTFTCKQKKRLFPFTLTRKRQMWGAALPIQTRWACWSPSRLRAPMISCASATAVCRSDPLSLCRPITYPPNPGRSNDDNYANEDDGDLHAGSMHAGSATAAEYDEAVPHVMTRDIPVADARCGFRAALVAGAGAVGRRLTAIKGLRVPYVLLEHGFGEVFDTGRKTVFHR